MSHLLPDHVHVLVYAGLLLLASQVGGHIANALRAPRVTGYLVVGILLGPSATGLLSRELVEHDLALVTDLALAVIAFSIGGSLALPKVKRLGALILGVAVSQALGAMIAVTAAMAVVLPMASPAGAEWQTSVAVALVVGAVSAATAPAAILSIVRECRARGGFTTTLLGVVAVDDALTIVLFAIALNVATTLMGGDAEAPASMILAPTVHLLMALAVGTGTSWILRVTSRYVSGRVSLLANTLGAIFLASGLALSVESSPLLASMTLGFFVVNFGDRQQDAFASVDQIEESLFGVFFALAGAHIDVGLLRGAGGVALAIVGSRFLGKYLGSRLAAHVVGADTTVRRYLGLGLLPKAGVTVGLILQAIGRIPGGALTELAFNGVLVSVLLNELISPFFVRFALVKAGEAHPSTPHADGGRDE